MKITTKQLPSQIIPGFESTALDLDLERTSPMVRFKTVSRGGNNTYSTGGPGRCVLAPRRRVIREPASKSFSENFHFERWREIFDLVSG